MSIHPGEHTDYGVFDEDEFKPRSRVVRKKDGWHAVRGWWDRACESYEEAQWWAGVFDAKKMCAYKRCLRSQMKINPWGLHLCRYHSLNAGQILHWETDFIKEDPCG